jgi:hypothetical protein
MTVRIVRLGTPRWPDEDFASAPSDDRRAACPSRNSRRQNWYDVWYPTLAPSAATLKLGQQADTAGAVDRFRAEIPVRDGSASSCANHRIAGEVVPSRQLLGRMLLRGCGALPSINLARAPGRAGCGCVVTVRQSDLRRDSRDCHGLTQRVVGSLHRGLQRFQGRCPLRRPTQDTQSDYTTIGTIPIAATCGDEYRLSTESAHVRSSKNDQLTGDSHAPPTCD